MNIGDSISIIIPHYPKTEELDILLSRCVFSLQGYDEIIVVVNDGTGFAKAVNQGLKLAKGDYLMVVNNDIEWGEGRLESLCIDGTVTSPKVNGGEQPFWGCFFCIPRSVYSIVGGLSEEYGIGYYEDDDYIKRLGQASVPMQCVTSCNIETKGGATMQYFDKQTLMLDNKLTYEKKWL